MGVVVGADVVVGVDVAVNVAVGVGVMLAIGVGVGVGPSAPGISMCALPSMTPATAAFQSKVCSMVSNSRSPSMASGSTPTIDSLNQSSVRWPTPAAPLMQYEGLEANTVLVPAWLSMSVNLKHACDPPG